ncbi:hypothetical protein HYX10_06025 [Candidatus Woesearchaeota archaeon]|nr:hypothetical protein [Candidatus Woesearchaeota archaeon]
MSEKEKYPDLINIILFWTGLGLIILWVVLKLLGIINTPVWQQVLPYVGAIFGAGAFYRMFMEMNGSLRGVERKIGHMDKDIGHLRMDADVLKNDVSGLKNDVGGLKIDMGIVKSRLRL